MIITLEELASKCGLTTLQLIEFLLDPEDGLPIPPIIKLPNFTVAFLEEDVAHLFKSHESPRRVLEVKQIILQKERHLISMPRDRRVA